MPASTSILIPRLIGRGETPTQSDLITLQTAISDFQVDTGRLPSAAEGLNALLVCPTDLPGWHGPYIESAKIPVDPWDEPYQYAYPGTHNKDSYNLWSKGRDKQSGTTDDIGNWDAGGSSDK